MAFDQLERVVVHERPENVFERVRDERAHLVGPHAAQQHQAVLRGLAHRLVRRAAGGEENLPERRLHELTAGDQPASAERPGKRERARASKHRPVEVEERRGPAGHEVTKRR
jgi:hypothetical protein